MHVTRPCRECKKVITVEVSDEEIAMYKAGALIQDAFPELDANSREFLINGICGECFDGMFV